MPRRYWLLKSEPSEFSIHDLAACKGKRAEWDGVRNYQARNLLRDEMKKGDGVLFYHSNAKPMGIVGTATVVKEGYPDHTQFEVGHAHEDPKSDPDDPRWYMVDIKLERIFDEILDRDTLRGVPALKDMMLLRRGSRLSVQPVTAKEWNAILKLADAQRR